MSENTSEAGRRDPPRTCFESLSGQPYLPVGPEAYVEKALRELALQTTRGGEGPAAALALGAEGLSGAGGTTTPHVRHHPQAGPAGASAGRRSVVDCLGTLLGAWPPA